MLSTQSLLSTEHKFLDPICFELDGIAPEHEGHQSKYDNESNLLFWENEYSLSFSIDVLKLTLSTQNQRHKKPPKAFQLRQNFAGFLCQLNSVVYARHGRELMGRKSHKR